MADVFSDDHDKIQKPDEVLSPLFHCSAHHASSSRTLCMADALTDNHDSNNIQKPVEVVNSRDLGLIPIPRRLRYSQGATFYFGKALNTLFAISSAAAITQLYLSTPILTKLSHDFKVPYDQVGHNFAYRP
jgi:hypothetical protein